MVAAVARWSACSNPSPNPSANPNHHPNPNRNPNPNLNPNPNPYRNKVVCLLGFLMRSKGMTARQAYDMVVSCVKNMPDMAGLRGPRG